MCKVMKLKVGMRFSSWEHKLGFKFTWTKDLSKLNKHENFCAFKTWTLQNKLFGGRKVKTIRKIPTNHILKSIAFFLVITQYMHTFGLTKSPESPKYL